MLGPKRRIEEASVELACSTSSTRSYLVLDESRPYTLEADVDCVEITAENAEPDADGHRVNEVAVRADGVTVRNTLLRNRLSGYDVGTKLVDADRNRIVRNEVCGAFETAQIDSDSTNNVARATSTDCSDDRVGIAGVRDGGSSEKRYSNRRNRTCERGLRRRRTAVIARWITPAGGARCSRWHQRSPCRKQPRIEQLTS